MARARNIKPGFFTNDLLAECQPLARILFQGLWCHADREGRIEDRPKKFKAEILPYDQCDADLLLTELESSGFIVRYESSGKRYLQVVNFSKHQNPHIKEPESTIPAPCKSGASTAQAPDENGSSPADSLLPITSSLNPDSLTKKESASTTQPTSTASGRVCARLRKAGIQGVNPSNPKLLALLTAGIPENEFGDLADEPGARGKSLAWILAAIEGRRRDAAAAGTVQVVVKEWHETASGIEAKAVELGIPRETENGIDAFPAFKDRVFAAAGIHAEAA